MTDGGFEEWPIPDPIEVPTGLQIIGDIMLSDPFSIASVCKVSLV